MDTNMNRQQDVDAGIGVSVEKMVDRYLKAHDGGSIPSGLYHRVVREVESALFKTVMEFVGNNQVKASKILGINRNTLRKKMLDDEYNKESN